jgi:hypothetical protein
MELQQVATIKNNTLLEMLHFLSLNKIQEAKVIFENQMAQLVEGKLDETKRRIAGEILYDLEESFEATHPVTGKKKTFWNKNAADEWTKGKKWTWKPSEETVRKVYKKLANRPRSS